MFNLGFMFNGIFTAYDMKDKKKGGGTCLLLNVEMKRSASR